MTEESDGQETGETKTEVEPRWPTERRVPRSTDVEPTPPGECDHRDVWGSLMLDGQCMVCGHRQPPAGGPSPSPLLTNGEVTERLSKLDGWWGDDLAPELRDIHARGTLQKSYRFADFVTAFAFMSAVALVCQRMDHHPTWTNIWNMVQVSLATESAHGITGKDFELASEMERLAARLGAAG